MVEQTILGQDITIKNNSQLEKGVHIFADFYNVSAGREEMLVSESLERFCEEQVARVGLTQVGKLFHQFPGGGVTGMVLLAESHIAIHTWPEKDYLTLDIYVCNVSQDNTMKARALYKSMEDLFLPGRKNFQEIDRE